MATVLERFNKLGLAHSNVVLEQFGNHIKALFMRNYSYWVTIDPQRPPRYGEIKKKAQQEEGRWIFVNDYPEEFTPRMDEEILDYIIKKPTRWHRNYISNWWAHKRNRPTHLRLREDGSLERCKTMRPQYGL